MPIIIFGNELIFVTNYLAGRDIIVPYLKILEKILPQNFSFVAKGLINQYKYVNLEYISNYFNYRS